MGGAVGHEDQRTPRGVAGRANGEAPSHDNVAGGHGRSRQSAVLIVDDEPAIREAYARVLRRANFRTCEADTGSDALQMLSVDPIDAVILDQQMPLMTGMELVNLIRSLPSHDKTPVLFVSGDSSAEVRIAALHAGATDFMVKPVVLDELVARVEAQVRLNSAWQVRLRSISHRAATVAKLTDLGSHHDSFATASKLCECISAAHADASVGVYETLMDGTHVRLAAIGRQPELVADGIDDDGGWLRRRIRGAPWVQREPPSSDGQAAETFWACAPLRRDGRSLGLLVLGGDTLEEMDQLLAAAVDYASVAALHLGGEMVDALSLRHRRNSIRQILSARAFHPVFQPILRLEDGALIGFEALTRFADGKRPDHRLAEAAEVGLAAEMEMALITAALESSAALTGTMWLSCNLSPAVLVGRNDELAGLIASSPHPLVIELTEHSPIDDYEEVRAALANLGSTVRLSVDDAGAGFASLRHVVDLHPHFLKLDRSWVTGIDRDTARQALVAGLVGFSKRTGTAMIAEGIETDAERLTLEHLSVELGQGYLLGRPQSVADLALR